MAVSGIRVTDCHIHIHPWRDMAADVVEVLTRGQQDPELLMEIMYEPALLLRTMDEEGIDRVGLVNYPSPDVMRTGTWINEHAARYASADPSRLLPFGGVHPRYTKDPSGDVDALIGMGVRMLKLHPNHQQLTANAYTEGLDALARIYKRCEDRGLPVLIHTGTSIFPRARCKYGNPLELDDVALDFPDLQIVLAHGGRPFYMGEAFFILRRHRNVWFDLSGIPPKSLLEYFPRLAELEHKLLWGTDWPSPGITRMRKNVDQFMALPLADSVRRAALETNPERLLPDR
ncbi:MAG TPA: amidohydrolase family protein [Gemmatimonadaceae bacterium]|nr:amidohydrolase family protein [Gemmatimonadaceae bacterium]